MNRQLDQFHIRHAFVPSNVLLCWHRGAFSPSHFFNKIFIF
jgi:hypothetical protein